jgi:hypothetical protein
MSLSKIVETSLANAITTLSDVLVVGGAIGLLVFGSKGYCLRTLTITATSAYICMRVVGEYENYLLQFPKERSLYIHRNSEMLADDYRDDFRGIKIDQLYDNKKHHSHPTAAAIRTSMNNAIDDYVRGTARPMYSVSMSTADERKGMAGNRYFYTGKDLSYGYRDDKLLPDHVIKMSDTGYYADLPDYLVGNEVLLYEIVPFRVAGGVADACYTFDKGGHLVEEVSGNAHYKHALWDMNSDHFIVRKHRTIWDWLMRRPRVAWEYLVEMIIHPDYPEYRIIGFFPRRKITGKAVDLIDGPELKRIEVNQGEWTRMDSQMVDGSHRGVRYTSLGKPGVYHDVFLPTEVLDSILTRSSFAKDYTLGQVEHYLEQCMSDTRFKTWADSNQNVKTAATIVYEYCKTSTSTGPKNLVTVGKKQWSYTPINKRYRPLADEYQPTMRDITPDGKEPPFPGSLCPTKGDPSVDSAIEHRITRCKNSVVPPTRYNTYQDEFVEFLIPKDKVGKGIMLGEEDVLARLERPSQRTLFQRAMDWRGCESNVNKAFIKREAYPNITAPRMISTLQPTLKTDYSAGMYCFSDEILHNVSWYAFGHSPSTLEQMLGKIATGKTNVLATDFSKFDGYISEFIRSLETKIIRRFFRKKDAHIMAGLHAKQFKLTGVVNGSTISYPPGFNRLSGSPETSGFNSTDNAFFNYCAYRESGKTPTEAWSSLGIYGGDDGLSFDMPAESFEQVARDLGFVVKAELILRGAVVPFLGRFWHNLWEGQATSTADIPRQLTKVHLTTAGNEVSLAEVLRGKALGFYHSDRETPILGVWARRVLELTGGVEGEAGSFANYLVKQGGILKQPSREQALTHLFRGGIVQASQVERLESMFSQAKNLEDMFPSRSVGESQPEVKVPAIVGGEIRGMEGVRTQGASPIKTTPRVRRPMKGG